MKEQLYKVRIVAYLLAIYVLLQLLVSCFSGFLQATTLLFQEFFFIAAIVLSLIRVLKEEVSKIKKLVVVVFFLFLIANLILFIFWVVTVYYDPEINWSLKGNKYEVDPWYYVLYLPVINFAISFLALSILFLCRVANRRRGSVSD